MCGGRVWACNTLHVHDRGGSTVHSTALLLVNYVDVWNMLTCDCVIQSRQHLPCTVDTIAVNVASH